MDSYEIRAARPDDVSLLPRIEIAAATLFRPYVEALGLKPEQLEHATSTDEFLGAQREGLLCVAVDEDDSPFGFALLRKIDDWIHLDELDVHPSHGRRGAGSALLEDVFRVACERNSSGVTLCTFKDVPWNLPFYERQGFATMPPSEYTPELKRLVELEGERGLRPNTRSVMVRVAGGTTE